MTVKVVDTEALVKDYREFLIRTTPSIYTEGIEGRISVFENLLWKKFIGNKRKNTSSGNYDSMRLCIYVSSLTGIKFQSTVNYGEGDASMPDSVEDMIPCVEAMIAKYLRLDKRCAHVTDKTIAMVRHNGKVVEIVTGVKLTMEPTCRN